MPDMAIEFFSRDMEPFELGRGTVFVKAALCSVVFPKPSHEARNAAGNPI